jgi:hypothetical protein
MEGLQDAQREQTQQRIVGFGTVIPAIEKLITVGECIGFNFVLVWKIRLASISLISCSPPYNNAIMLSAL